MVTFLWDLLTLAGLANILEWLNVSLLKDHILMSKNGLSMEDISHA